MGTNSKVNYDEEKGRYYKVLIALLVLTALTFVQPYVFHAGTFSAQMLIAVIKAWLIVMYYMHLKGEKLIGMMALFSMFLVFIFFIIVIGVDVVNFQFAADSHITAAAGAEAHTSAHSTH